MSLVSCETPGLTPSSLSCGFLVLSAMIQSLLKIRFAQRQQRPCRQCPEEHCQPQPAKPDRGREVEPRNRENRMVDIDEVRFHQPKHVNNTNTNDENGDRRNRLRILLQRLRQQ